jgi:hypothetical protein
VSDNCKCPKFEPKRKKPPVGLRPRWLAMKHRTQEILDAMERYSLAGMGVPLEWLVELAILIEDQRLPSTDTVQEILQDRVHRTEGEQ